MSGRIERAEAAIFVGGVLVMLGAWLPWLTLFAGLQRYSGLIGIHGQLLFAGGALAMAGSLAMLRTSHRWVRWATLLLGAVLLGFDAWLLTGLTATLHRGVSAMLVPRAGPGLFVSSLGIALVIAGSGMVLARGDESGPRHGARSIGERGRRIPIRLRQRAIET
jgi:hypothetical protein